MRISFIINKWANFLWFIECLSDHDKNWQIYHVFWQKKFRKLNKQEQKTIENYNKVARRLEKQKLLKLVMAVFSKNANWQKISIKLEKLLNHEQIKTLKNTFDIFQEKFDKVWSKCETKIKSNQSALIKGLDKIKPKLNKYYYCLSKFYDVPTDNFSLKAVLFFSPIQDYSSGRSIDAKTIWLILPNIKTRAPDIIDSYWWLFLHESIHSLFETENYKRRIKKFINSRKKLNPLLSPRFSISELIRECIITSLLMALNNESGLIHKHNQLQNINIRYLKKCFAKDNKVLFTSNCIKRYVALKLQDLTKKYIKTGRKIDTKFIKNVLDVLDNYPTNLLQDAKTD